MLNDNQTGGILKHRVKVRQVGIVVAHATLAFVGNGLRQLERFRVALLIRDVPVDGIHLRCVDEGTLNAYGFVALQEQHVAASDELVGTHAVENGLRVDALADLEGDAGREVSLDGTRDNVSCRSLCGNNHVYAHGACLLGNAGNGQLNLLASRHNQVAILVDDHYNVGHVFVSLLWVQLAGDELLVVILDVAFASGHQQFVAGIHLHAE